MNMMEVITDLKFDDGVLTVMLDFGIYCIYSNYFASDSKESKSD